MLASLLEQYDGRAIAVIFYWDRTLEVSLEAELGQGAPGMDHPRPLPLYRFAG